MAKAKITRKWLAENYHCTGVGYCDLYYLLYYTEARFYTSGIYGWNFDAYIVRVGDIDFCITTGYRGMIHDFEEKNVHQYNDEAKKVLNNSELSYEEKKEKVNKLLQQFIKETFKM